MRKLLSWSIGMLAGVSVVLVGLQLLVPRHGINKNCFERIQKGMTFEEVIRILGAPGDHSIPRDAIIRHSRLVEYQGNGLLPCAREEEWIADDFAIWVSFDVDGKVMDKNSAIITNLDGSPVSVSLMDRLRHWLHLPWG